MSRLLPFLLVAAACGSPAAETPEAHDEPVAEAPAPVEEKAEPAAATGAPARGDDAGRKSKNGTTTMKVGDVDVTVTYGRPSVNGRTVWGELVPYDEVWRTGADEASVITFSGPVMVGEEKVEAGSYALFTVPGEEEWTIILNETAEQWGSYDYDPGKDVVRVKVKPETGEKTEQLTIEPEGDTLYVKWAETKVPVPVKGA